MGLILAVLIAALPAVAILRGSPATEDVVTSAIQVWSMKGNHLMFRCSGTMIAPDVVLTEATCLYATALEKHGDTFLISRSPKTDFSKPLADILQRILAVVKMDVRHPSENLALLFLEQAVPVRPAILMQPNEADQLLTEQEQELRIAGSGFHEPPPNAFWSSDQRKPGIKHVGASTLSSIIDRHIEFGVSQNDSLACTGDEGGPIIIRIRSRYRNQERLIGIIQSNANLALCASPSSGLRIDAFQPFIKEQLEQGCQKGVRVWCEIKGLIPPDTETLRVIEIPSPPKPTGATEPKMPASPPESPPQKNKGVRLQMESVGCHCSRSFFQKNRAK